jgi:hypothetical protein
LDLTHGSLDPAPPHFVTQEYYFKEAGVVYRCDPWHVFLSLTCEMHRRHMVSRHRSRRAQVF